MLSWFFCMSEKEAQPKVKPKFRGNGKLMKSEWGLNPQQERFCQLYATDAEFFGNGREAYLAVYDLDRNKPNWKGTASEKAYQLLQKPYIIKRINQLLEDIGFNEAHVDKQLAFLLTQQADLNVKLGAIREFNKLKSRITDKHEHVVKDFSGLLAGLSGSPSKTEAKAPEGEGT